MRKHRQHDGAEAGAAPDPGCGPEPSDAIGNGHDVVPGSAHTEWSGGAGKKRGTAPSIAELAEIERNAGRDLAWIVSVAVAICGLSVSMRLVDRLVNLSDALSSRDFNGLITLMIVAPLATGAYAYLRYREGMAAQRQLARLTVHDSLTGLPNRRFLGDSFRQMLTDQDPAAGRVAVLFIDLDGFKEVNDSHGHETGDRLMQAVAQRLRQAVKPQDAVVRYAGDEFVIIVTDVPSTAVAERIADRLIKVVELPFEIGNDRIQISAAAGVTLAEAGCVEPEDVVRDADAAMYQAKAHGPGTFAAFDRSMRDRLTPAGAERRLAEALERGEFALWYQPVVSLWSGRLVGAEALLRWEHPERGQIRPDVFLPALDETGLIVPVGRWALAQACAQSRAWADASTDRPPINVTVNLSARQIKQADFVSKAEDILVQTGAVASSIYLEIDERALLNDKGVVWQTLRGAKRLGLRLALDDFGAGLTSLKHLHDLDLDLLKIDPSYVAGLGIDARGTSVVEHVIGLAKALNVVTLAEAVETREQAEQLRTLGCDLAQGYYFSTPQPATVISELLAQPGPLTPDRTVRV